MVGLWQGDGPGEKVTATGTDVAEVKGWMTLGDVSAAYKVPVGDIVKELQLPADTDGTAQLKDLESGTFSVTKLREWLKSRGGQ